MNTPESKRKIASWYSSIERAAVYTSPGASTPACAASRLTNLLGWNPYDTGSYPIVYSDDNITVCTTRSRKHELSQITSDIESYGDYLAGWDGYDAPPISKNVIDDAIVFLQSMPSSIAMPDITPTADNELLMVWEAGDRKVIISFLGDTKLHCFARDGDQKSYYDNVEYNYINFPKAIHDHLNSFKNEQR